ncbi:MAG: exodeoxyribonuclease VII small subunit [Spirochaetaceae bacterium]|nr:MAG: exodeoxyribonuclease VII small subunit [Spirochaetaceae bacterium]
MKGFEERLHRLEELSDQLRDTALPLDDAVQKFEEGVKLARSLERDLTRVERRVQILVNEPDAEGEKPVLELFPELNDLISDGE